jgi:hypothetical protein
MRRFRLFGAVSVAAVLVAGCASVPCREGARGDSVSVAALMLVEEGKFGLADPASKYLTEPKGRRSGSRGSTPRAPTCWKEVPAQREMAAQDLLRHASSLAYGIFGKSMVKQKHDEATLYGDPSLTNPRLVRRSSQLPASSATRSASPARDTGAVRGRRRRAGRGRRGGRRRGWRRRRVLRQKPLADSLESPAAIASTDLG